MGRLTMGDLFPLMQSILLWAVLFHITQGMQLHPFPYEHTPNNIILVSLQLRLFQDEKEFKRN